MRLGDWYRQKTLNPEMHKQGQARGFVWDVADGIVELRQYNKIGNEKPSIYRVTPEELEAKWTLERKNDSGQIVNPKHFRAEVRQ